MSKEHKKISRRSILKGAAILGTLQLIPGFVRRAAAQAAEAKAFVMGVPSSADGLSTIVAQSDYVGRLIERSLLDYDRKGGTFTLVPGTAKEMPEILDDGLRFRFKLREDAFYHDGSPVNAQSIAAWVDMQINPDNPNNKLYTWRSLGRVTNIEKITVVDDHTIDFKLKKFNAAQLDWFTDPGFSGSPTAILQATPDLTTKEAAAGPFMVRRHVRGETTVLQRFDKFFDKEEGVAPNIGLRPIPELNSRIAALEAGEIDWMDGLSAEAANRLKGNDRIVVAEQKTLNVWFVSMDMRKKPFDDLRVRQAMNYAVDKDALIRDVLGGGAERSYSPLSPQYGDFYAGDEVQHYDYNPDKARQLLEEAGLKGGFKTTLFTNTGRAGQMKPVEMSTFLQANWKAVGIDCDIQAIEWGAFEERRRKGEFPLATRGWTPASGDPDSVLSQNFLGSMVPPVQRNVAYLQDKEVDDFLNAGMATMDGSERAKAFRAAQKRIVDLAPWVFVCHEIAYEAYSVNLKGYKPHPAGRGIGLTRAYKV